MPVRPRRFEIDCQLGYTLEGPTDFIFQVHVDETGDQRVLDEHLRLTKGAESHVYVVPASGQRILRVRAPAGPFTLRYGATVELRRPATPMLGEEWKIGRLPDETLNYLLPTRYCESDLLGSATGKLFGDVPPGIARVHAICDWIHRHIDYRVGTSDSTTTARDTFLSRAGVCRDFAHLAITFCRALCIPARLAVGYAVFEEPPPDFHAILEAHVDGRWWLFDPTRLSPPRDLVRIATGHDAKDVAFSTIYGPARARGVRPDIRRVA